MDESGTPDLRGNTSHFILVGLAIPVWHWKKCDHEIAQLKRKHCLDDKVAVGQYGSEIHATMKLNFETENGASFEGENSFYL